MAFCLIAQTSFIVPTTIKGPNCSIVHEGTFVYQTDDDEVTVIIKGNKHTELHQGGKYKIRSTIEWINDCEYKATLIKTNLPDFPYPDGTTMDVKITEVKNNQVYYTCTVGKKTWDGKMSKVK